MNLLVDTSVWSRFLRRRKTDANDPYIIRFRYHIENQDCIHLIGSILQELLDGVKEQKHFDLLREYLAPFPLIDLVRKDFIEASQLRNRCRHKGVQASPTDFLICAACMRRNYPLLTADKDFKYISLHCELDLISLEQC
ncbi:MAG: PIN domain-containing protein [Deltaproteobacteria bacterium]|nr:PIN domain-containing protein [Deltaproteobacteria bacterium]